MKIKIKELIFAEFLDTLSDMYLLDHFYKKKVFTSGHWPGANSMSEH